MVFFCRNFWRWLSMKKITHRCIDMTRFLTWCSLIFIDFELKKVGTSFRWNNDIFPENHHQVDSMLRWPSAHHWSMRVLPCSVRWSPSDGKIRTAEEQKKHENTDYKKLGEHCWSVCYMLILMIYICFFKRVFFWRGWGGVDVWNAWKMWWKFDWANIYSVVICYSPITKSMLEMLVWYYRLSFIVSVFCSSTH